MVDPVNNLKPSHSIQGYDHFPKFETQITKLLTPEMRGSKQGQWLRIAGINVVLKEDQENAINGKQSVQNRHQHPLLPQNHRQERMAEVLREERVSEAEVHLGS